MGWINQMFKEELIPILMNIDKKKIHQKLLANQIQQHMKRIVHYDQEEFIPRMQGWFNVWQSIHVIHLINRIKNKTTWSSQQTQERKKSIWQNPTPLHKKLLNQLEIQWNFVKLVEYLQKIQGDIVVKSYMLSPSDQKQDKNANFFHFCSVL